MTKTPTPPTGQRPVSPTKAAQLLQVSRRTIMRAIESHNLKATRDNRNHWKIAPDDLNKWASAQWTPTEQMKVDTPTLPTSEGIDLIEARAENKHLKSQLSSTKLDRDKWREMAEKLSDKPRRWWRI